MDWQGSLAITLWEYGRLFARLGIDDDGDGTVIDEADEHVSAEFTGLDWIAEILREPRQEALIQWNGEVRSGRANVGRAIAFFGAGEQGELADDENSSAHLLNGTVHHIVFIIEDSEPDDFSAQPFDVFVRVSFFDGHKHEQALLNGAFDFSVNGYIGFGNSLDNCTHALAMSLKQRMIWGSCPTAKSLLSA